MFKRIQCQFAQNVNNLAEEREQHQRLNFKFKKSFLELFAPIS